LLRVDNSFITLGNCNFYHNGSLCWLSCITRPNQRNCKST